MNALPVGTVLMQKYRIDRHALEGRDVSLYDATDLPRARHVCIKVFRSSARFQHDVCGPRVVDVGASEGLPYVVVGDAACAMPHRSKPPPLPARARSKSKGPPPLPRQPSVIVTLDEDEPTEVEPSTLDEAVFEKLRAPSSSRIVWVAVVAAVLAALTGWWLRERLGQAAVAPPHAPSVAALLASPNVAAPSPPETPAKTAAKTVAKTAVAAPPTLPADTTRATPEQPAGSPAPSPGDPLTL
jgi:hypothetical protein